ncbi:MAG: hypothetical protein KDB53_14965 [Planctomycetes bacterium]|nr:hypothetical protein [Planctomycetota bacterium]
MKSCRGLATVFAASLISVCVSAQGPGGPGPGGPGPGPGQGSMGPPQNPTTPQKAVLGKMLFWDEQLSSDNTVACGTCHRPGQGGTDPRTGVHPGVDGNIGTPDDIFGSPGVVRSDASNDYLPDAIFGLQRQVTGRHSPSFIGVQAAPSLFWDGRAGETFVDPTTGAVVIPQGGALESQVLAPPLSSAEMAHDGRDWTEIANKLQSAQPMKLATNLPADISSALALHPTYPDLFNFAFGSTSITPVTIAFAIAAYERTLIADQTPFDAFLAGNPAALTFNQRMGEMIFRGPGRCVICHGGPHFSDNGFHNNGLRPASEDLGRQVVTGSPVDAGAFRTSPLRNVGLRNRFMHNGAFQTLTQVVNFYNGGGGPFPNKSPLLIPLNLNPQQRNALVDFLTVALTDPRVTNETAPFDRPTLSREVFPQNPRVYGLPSAGTGGVAPEMIALSPPNVNNIDWKIGLGRGRGGAGAYLGVNHLPAPPGSSINGVPIHIDLTPGTPLFLPMTLNGPTGAAGQGYTTFRTQIANNPALSGLKLYFQWFVVDPMANGSVAASAGAELTFF